MIVLQCTAFKNLSSKVSQNIFLCGIFFICIHDIVLFVCKIPLLARRTRPSARATIGYLVYNTIIRVRYTAREDKICCIKLFDFSNIQRHRLYARYLCSRDALGLKAGRPSAARDDRVSCIQRHRMQLIY